MHRREFITVAAGAVAGGALGCAVPGTGARVAAAGSTPIDATAFHASRRFARTAFGRIAYVERGAGPVALFLHGLPLNGFQWRGALERLWPHRRCIAPDSMGLGYSEVPERQSLAPEAQASMFAALLDVLEIPAVDIVASDSGGAVAQLFVARYPERVRTLLLTNCDVHEDSPPPALLPVIAAAHAGTFADQVLVPQMKDKANARLATGLGGCCYTDPAHLTDEAIECYLTPLVSSPLRKAQLHSYVSRSSAILCWRSSPRSSAARRRSGWSGAPATPSSTRRGQTGSTEPFRALVACEGSTGQICSFRRRCRTSLPRRRGNCGWGRRGRR